jgi:uncharacterized protein (DUF1330 family)
MAAYIVTNATITDPDGLADYSASVGPSLAGRDFKVHVANNDATALEGEAGERVVIMEFPTREAALDWYHSDAYQAVIGKRLNSTKGFLVLVDGLG